MLMASLSTVLYAFCTQSEFSVAKKKEALNCYKIIYKYKMAASTIAVFCFVAGVLGVLLTLTPSSSAAAASSSGNEISQKDILGYRKIIL